MKTTTNSLYGMFGGFPSISEMYIDKCFCCVADRKGNECKGRETCGKTWKRYEAITNPEWHHVSLATLANIDFDMLDRKRQVYLKAHRELKRTLADLSKCKTGHTYEARARKFFRDMKSKYYRNVISHQMLKYLDLQISMSNVINGVWSSYVEPAMGLHESRRYMIEYYDTELDMTDYTTVTANNEIDAMKYFIRSTHGTKIVVECNRVGGVKEN